MPEELPVPRRDIRDPQALRALAHPLRLRLMEELIFGGPATATELSERVGESPANCSWHLRQLARYGFVEEAGGGTGRQRPWRYVVQANHFGESGEDSDLALAGDAALDVLIGREFEQLQAWQAAHRAESVEWQEAAYLNQSMAWLTAEELAAASREIQQIYLRYVDRFADPERRPADARPVRLMAWGFPARPAPKKQ